MIAMPLLVKLYIVLFLHQTTTTRDASTIELCCISYYSYIKPQLFPLALSSLLVVYRTIPTSNHNHRACLPRKIFVVYRTIPTSNHNYMLVWKYIPQLYIVLFLHQTTTYNVDIAHNQHITITFINKK